MISIKEKYIISKHIGHIGKIKEYDGLIYCHISKKTMKKLNQKSANDLICGSVLKLSEIPIGINVKNKTDRQLTYVFENLRLVGPLTLDLSHANVIIRNCIIEDSLTFKDHGKSKVTLDNNIYRDTINKSKLRKAPANGNRTINGKVDKLTIINENFKNEWQRPIKTENSELIAEHPDCNHFGIEITANTVNIEDTIIEGNKNVAINIAAEKVNICDSDIKLDESQINIYNNSNQLTNIAIINTKIKALKDSIINLIANNKLIIISSNILSKKLNLKGKKPFIKDSILEGEETNLYYEETPVEENSQIKGKVKKQEITEEKKKIIRKNIDKKTKERKKLLIVLNDIKEKLEEKVTTSKDKTTVKVKELLKK